MDVKKEVKIGKKEEVEETESLGELEISPKGGKGLDETFARLIREGKLPADPEKAKNLLIKVLEEENPGKTFKVNGIAEKVDYSKRVKGKFDGSLRALKEKAEKRNEKIEKFRYKGKEEVFLRFAKK